MAMTVPVRSSTSASVVKGAARARPPENLGEAVELADLLQPSTGDHSHTAVADVIGRWRPDPDPARLIDDGCKLVRDGIPDVIRGQGLVPLVRPCRDLDERYRRALDKLNEERGEYQDSVLAGGRGSGDLWELADLLEIVEALAFLDGYTFADVCRAKAEKRQARGGFRDWVVWYGNVPPSTPVV